MSREQTHIDARGAILILRVARSQERDESVRVRLAGAILSLVAQSGRSDLLPDWLRCRAEREGLLP
jgi:hypothetical protein